VRRITRCGAPLKSLLATAALAPLVLATGCAEGGGVRIEGTAATAVVVTPSPSVRSVPGGKLDPVAQLRADPGVSADIKSQLKPCGGRDYPIETSYGSVTGDTAPDVVINVATCGDGVGIGSYVYRMDNGRYVNVFRDEQPPVHIDLEKGDLQVTHQIYSDGDPVCCPSGEDVISYHWRGGRFTETSRTHSDYGKKAND
jgi:hypothetical protein